MNTAKPRKVCPQCDVAKGTTAFKKGTEVCIKCVNHFAKGDLNGGNRVQTTEFPQTKSLTELFPGLDCSHIERCEKIYKEYIKRNPTQFMDGEYVTVIDGEFIPRGYPDYQTAVRATDQLAQGRNWFYAVKGHENSVSYSFPAMTLPFSGRMEDGDLNVQAPTRVRKTPNPPDEKVPEVTFECLVDTGASVCAIPIAQAEILRPKVRKNGTVMTGGGNRPCVYLDVEYNVKNMGYIRVECLTYPDLQHKLLGLNFLGMCKQTWYGVQEVQIRLLGPGETPQAEREIQDLIDGINRMELTPSLVMQKLSKEKEIVAKYEKEIKRLEEENRKLKVSYDRLGKQITDVDKG